ncbi:MAG: decarboxylating 6-phosphogluconate dehydrogenase [Thermoplasmata archaeon]|nr:decarboxylating 6-phosphogluconate dehydrogenase [Thermoplasmata archaeon]
MEQNKELGFIGLGRMGGNMVNRMLASKKVDVVVWNRSPEPVQKVVENGARGAPSIEELVNMLKQEKKIVWLMLPAGEVTENTFQKVLGLLKQGDIIIDGANSYFQDTLRRHKLAEEKGVGMLDVGVSGGIIAASRGYPMMVGGAQDTYDYCEPIFESFGHAEGYGRVGGSGAGHYVKMIHNAIEYGIMQAIAEGFDLLENGRFKNLDLKNIAHIWNHGTIISSFLMEMVESALKKSPKIDYLKPYVDDSGEGRWAAREAIEHAVPFVVNTYALHARFLSRDENSLAFRMLGAMRNEFGGHPIKK